MNVEDIVREQSKLLGVSESKLLAVYQRGFNDATDDHVNAGLARVQRYVEAHKSGVARWTPDADLLPKDYSMFEGEDTALVASGPYLSTCMGILSGDLSALDALIPHEWAEDVILDIDKNELHVSGEGWAAVVDLITGDISLLN